MRLTQFPVDISDCMIVYIVISFLGLSLFIWYGALIDKYDKKIDNSLKLSWRNTFAGLDITYMLVKPSRKLVIANFLRFYFPSSTIRAFMDFSGILPHRR